MSGWVVTKEEEADLWIAYRGQMTGWSKLRRFEKIGKIGKIEKDEKNEKFK